MRLKPLVLSLLAAPLLAGSAHAKLAAWFPLNDGPDVNAPVREVIAGADGFAINPDVILPGRATFTETGAGGWWLRQGGGIDIGGTEAVQPVDQFTISFWFQPAAFNTMGRLIETQVGGANNQSGIRIDLGAAPGNHVRALLRDGGTKNTQVTHPLELKNDGTWYFVAVRYDSTVGTGDALKVTVVEAKNADPATADITAATSAATTLGTGPLPYPHARATTLVGLETEAGNAANLNATVNDIAFYNNSDGKGVLTDEALAASYRFGPTGVKLINSFSAAANNTGTTGNAVLSWNVGDGLESLTLLKNGDPAGSTDLLALTTAGAGTITVPQTASTFHTLRAAGAGGLNVSTVSVVSGAPVITSLTTSAALVSTGGNAKLSWEVSGSDTLKLDPGNVDVTGQSSITVTPAASSTYTLTATNGAGSSSSSVLVRTTTGPLPVNSYFAGHSTNDEFLWRDNVGTKNWPLTGLIRHAPLEKASAATGITGSYQSTDVFSPAGITVASFQYADATTELWVRPDLTLLTADWQLLFESGGGQNGLAVLLNNTGLRFLGSSGNVRTVDLLVPTAGLELGDFIQILYTIQGTAQKADVTVRDVMGQTVTASANGKVVIGTNAASLLALTGAAVDLGGRTEVSTAFPDVLTGFAGEIAILNLYSRALTTGENTASFAAVVPVVPQLITSFETSAVIPPAGGEATLTWKVTGSPDTLTLTDVTAGSAPVNVLPATAGGQGTIIVKPAVPTTYSLRATKGTVTHSASVTVFGGKPIISSFTSSGVKLVAGESATLSWNVSGAETVELTPAGTETSVPTQRIVSPTATTTYTLTATNPTGSSTAEVIIEVQSDATPVHHYLASSEGNDEFTWADEVNARNWPLNSVTRNNPLVKPSAFSNLRASYQSADSSSVSGITTTSFQYADFTVELWVRPDLTQLSDGHQVIFESGGGQNGSSVLLTQSAVRFLGSSGNVRNLDLTVPTAGLKLDDFIQIVHTVKASTSQVNVYVRDVTGKTVTASATAKVTHGTNPAALFRYSTNEVSLGGRTELADVSPEGLTGFAGEIALLNIYDRALSTEAVEKAYQTSGGTIVTTPPTDPVRLEVTSATYDPATNRITLAWDSQTTGWYQAEISSDLAEWTPLGEAFQPATAGAAQAFQFPEGPKNFIRIRQVTAP